VTEFVSVHGGSENGVSGIATILLTRPPTNALSRQLCRELTEAAADVGARDDVTAVILFGGHEIFSAGCDVAEIRTLDAAEAARAEQVCRVAVDAVAAIPKPTVAAITGYALGGGLTLALAADWRVSGDNVKLGSTEILDGLAPAPGGPARLARVVGESRARDLVFTGRFAGAEESLAMGLVDELSAPDHVYDAARTWALRFTGSSPAALATAKAAFGTR
jgi:enoyl-CoA hydratase